MVGEYDSENQMIQRIADQKIVMENITDYLNVFSDEPRIQEVQNEIQALADVFMNLDEETISEQVSKDGARTLLGGNRIIITADEFNELKTATANYRNSFTNPKQG